MTSLFLTRLRAGLAAAVLLLAAGCAYYNTFYNAKAAYRAGLHLKEQNQHTQAKAKFDKAIEKSALVIKRWPKSRWTDDALFLVGMSYYQENQFSKAIRHFDQLGLAFPGSDLAPEAELYRGLALLADGQYGTARLVLDPARQKHPRFADLAAFHLAKSFVDRNELERASDSLSAFVQRFPKSRHRRRATKLLAEVSFSLRRFGEAERAYELYSRLSSDPKERALAKLRIAGCRHEQGKYQEAIAQVSDVLGRYPGLDEEANLLLGKALAETGREAEALAVWTKVKGPSDVGAEAAFRVGKHHEESAEFDKARAYYDTARTRRLDSDYGVLAVKRLALLDALAARTTGKKTGGDSLSPAEAMFLLAEVNNLNLGDFDKAMGLYQKVHDSFPDTDWAAKALFAKAWLTRNAKGDTSGAEPMLRQVIAGYPETEYADESRRWLGLPVPKREKKPEVKPETTAAVTPPAEKPSFPPGIGPHLAPEPLPAEPEEPIAEREPGMFPPGRREPGHLPGRPDRARVREERMGMRPELPEGTKEKPAVMDKSPAAPEPASPVRVAGAGDTVASGPALPSADTTPMNQGQRDKEAKGPSVRTLDSLSPRSLAPFFSRLEVVRFATDSWQIRAEDSARLAANAESLKAHPELKLVVVGHCDPRAGERYNQDLGRKRAQAVKDFLAAAGVDSDRITVRSEGKQRPISSGPEQYWLDRRVEFEPR